jgi:hypothetical protein
LFKDDFFKSAAQDIVEIVNTLDNVTILDETKKVILEAFAKTNHQ